MPRRSATLVPDAGVTPLVAPEFSGGSVRVSTARLTLYIISKTWAVYKLNSLKTLVKKTFWRRLGTVSLAILFNVFPDIFRIFVFENGGVLLEKHFFETLSWNSN